jgi:hypothetical protein
VDHIVQRLIDLMRSETDDPISICNQPCISPIIADHVMIIAVNLDYKPSSFAKEIGEVRADRNLSSKLEPADLPIAQP